MLGVMVMFLKTTSTPNEKIVTGKERENYYQLRNELLKQLINLIDPKTAKKTVQPDINCIMKTAKIIKNIRLVINAKGFISNSTNNIYENKFIKQLLNKIAEHKYDKDQGAKIISMIGIIGKNIEELLIRMQYIDELIMNNNVSRIKVFDEFQDKIKNSIFTINGYINVLIKKGVLKEIQSLTAIENKIKIFSEENDTDIIDYKVRDNRTKAFFWKLYLNKIHAQNTSSERSPQVN